LAFHFFSPSIPGFSGSGQPEFSGMADIIASATGLYVLAEVFFHIFG
jgi:hypothetical protein